MTKKSTHELQCSNKKCEKMYPISEVEKEALEEVGELLVKCPYCEASNTCTMENMRASIDE